jgi:predicted DNA-binding protein (MmcQ/YjbR family)
MLAVHFVRNDWVILNHHHINLGKYMRWTTVQAQKSENKAEHKRWIEKSYNNVTE